MDRRHVASRVARMAMRACAVTCVLALCAPTARGQSAADSAAVIEAAVAHWFAESGFSHPRNRIEAVCVGGHGPRAPTPDGREPPELGPGLSQVVSGLVLRETGLPRGESCAPIETAGRDRTWAWMADERGRPSVRFLVSAPLFDSADAAWVHTGMLAGTLWGGGFICRWARDPASGGWILDRCGLRWDA
jgi:hypothetical protein